VKTTIGLLSSRGQKHRSGTHAKAPSASKRRPAPGALSQDELLAKIDALDWDETVTPETAHLRDGQANAQYPDHSTSNWRVLAIAAVLAVVLTALYFVFAPEPAPRIAADEAPTPISAVGGAPATAGGDSQVPAVSESGAASVAAAEDRRAALYANAIAEADAKAQQKLDARRKAREAREAREAERARLAAQQERDRRQKEEARLRAERDAAEAARTARAREQAAIPKGPASPQELCAGEGGAIARGFCEARACGKTEWRSHPFCVKRVEEQMRSLGHGI
jgi:hypothetical protein